MTQAEKFKTFREKIGDTIAFDDGFKQLIGIELFDFIQGNNALKNEFYRRCDYLKNLADDKNFKLLQDNLFGIIQKILKLTSLQKIQELQQEWNNKLINRLKTRLLIDEKIEKEKDFLTLPELYLALQNKKNYYRLGDMSYLSPLEGEISIVTHIVPVKKQYEVTVEGFLKRIFPNKFITNKGRARLDELINEYNKNWYRLDELIYRMPIRLHLRNFEQFFLFCAEVYPRKGYEPFYEMRKNDKYENKELEKIKGYCFTVIDDLLEVLEEKIVSQKQKSNAISIFIRDVRLDEKNYLLEINNGEKVISFKSKKKGGGLDRETKQFKILYHLWDFRWELKDNRVLKKGDFASLENLVQGSGSESTEAAYKHIQRLNNRFRNEGVAIEIKGENERYRLIINKA